MAGEHPDAAGALCRGLVGGLCGRMGLSQGIGCGIESSFMESGAVPVAPIGVALAFLVGSRSDSVGRPGGVVS